MTQTHGVAQFMQQQRPQFRLGCMFDVVGAEGRGALKEFLGVHDGGGGRCHPDDLSAAHRIEERSAQTYEPYCAEYRLRARDGRWVWFRDEAVFVESDQEGPGYWQGVMIDITEQIAGAEARFLMADAGSPTLVRDGADESALYVLMPMRV